MLTWASRDVAVQPKVWLTTWRVLETDYETRHFIGHSGEENIGRVSTPISSFDRAKRTGRTLNGRVYKLLGPPGLDEDAVYVWEHYSRIWRFAAAEDVSEEYLLRISSDAEVGRWGEMQSGAEPL
jgi:hypothetical protein